MAFSTSLNAQISDAVSQAGVLVAGNAPAVALGSLYVTTSHALANAAHNATTVQHQSSVAAQAATTSGVLKLLSLASATKPLP